MHCILDCEHGTQIEKSIAYDKIIKLVGEEKAIKLATTMKKCQAINQEYEKLKADIENNLK